MPASQCSSHIFASLIVCDLALRELKIDTFASQALVHLRVSVEPVIHTPTLLFIEHDLEKFTAILSCPDTFTHNLNRIDEVGKDSIMDSSKRS